MAAIVYLSAPVDVTPGTLGSYQDVDVTANKPAGITTASGVILRAQNTSTTQYDFWVRKNGSTDQAAPNTHLREHHVYVSVGVDVNDIFECFIETGGTTVTVELIAFYNGDDVVFFDNAVNMTSGTVNDWQTMTLTGTTGTPDAAILTPYAKQGSGNDLMGARQINDSSTPSTDARNAVIRGPLHGGSAVIGLNSSQELQTFTQTGNGQWDGIGYFKQNTITTLFNATDVSLTTTTAWTNLPNLPADIDVGFIEVHNGTNTNVYDYGFAPDGDVDFQDIEGTPRAHCWGVSGSVANEIDGYIENANLDFFLTAYTTAAAGSSIPLITNSYAQRRRG